MDTAIFQNWLDRVGDAFFARDFAVYRDAVALPLLITTRTASMTVETVETLQQGFDAWADMLERTRATHMIRTARNVSELSPQMVTGLYDTRVLRDATSLMPPFQSSMVLRRTGDDWQAVAVTSGMSNENWPIVIPRVDGAGNTPTGGAA